jgi:ketosteroid isomerase-like protein
MTDDEIESLIKRLTRAEQDGDIAALDMLTTSDFTLVGPLGFLLSKDQWLDRYRSGALTTEILTWQPDTVRRHNDLAIVIGTQDQHAHYQGHPVDARFRATHVLLHLDAQWRVASTHLSPIGEPPTFGQQARSAPPTA